MIYKAYSVDSNKLLSLPESGMGYQIIEGRLSGYDTIKKYIVYNSELIIDFDTNFLNNKNKIVVVGYESILKESEPLNLHTASIRLVSKSSLVESRYLSNAKKEKTKRHSGGKGAIDSPKELADGEEYFVRISAYEDDKRIDFEKRKLKDGTYSTTLVDYFYCVRFNDDPIDRYALPNDEKINWVFFIQPKTNDSLQRGIVQPAFDHDGGGIEAYFENGTSEKTFILKKPYGKLDYTE